ncbi:hypothetical protein PINS_up018333 [Pythium insidiosum]|nr:hypothetical protein PINS_up018333 [Pythium insidiosum]
MHQSNESRGPSRRTASVGSTASSGASVSASVRAKHSRALGLGLRGERVTVTPQDDLTSELVQHTRVEDISTVFTFHDVIGTGHFGCVKKATSVKSGKEWAIKVVKLDNEVDRDALRNEIDILRRLHHPHIVRVLASYEDAAHMYMVMQLCKGKELYEHVYRDRRAFSEDDVRRLIRALLARHRVPALEQHHAPRPQAREPAAGERGEPGVAQAVRLWAEHAVPARARSCRSRSARSTTWRPRCSTASTTRSAICGASA